MHNDHTNCPVCNHVLPWKEEFCTTCNWENIHIPADASAGLKALYDRKLEGHRGAFKLQQKMKHENDERTKELNVLTEKYAALESVRKQLEKDIEIKRAQGEQFSKLEKEHAALLQETKTLKHDLEMEKVKNNRVQF